MKRIFYLHLITEVALLLFAPPADHCFRNSKYLLLVFNRNYGNFQVNYIKLIPINPEIPHLSEDGDSPCSNYIIITCT